MDHTYFLYRKGPKKTRGVFVFITHAVSVRYVKKANLCNHQFSVVVGSAIFGIFWAVVANNTFPHTKHIRRRYFIIEKTFIVCFLCHTSCFVILAQPTYYQSL